MGLSRVLETDHWLVTAGRRAHEGVSPGHSEMAGPDKDVMRARFASMSDEELSRVVTLEREDYIPQALELAEAELDARSVAPRPGLETLPSPHHQRRNIGLVWGDIYAALLGASGICNPIVAILRGAGAPVVVFSVVLSGVMIPVAYGLRLRRNWAWQLNWLFMVANALMIGRIGYVLTGFAWLLANGLYFFRRKSLFPVGRG